MLDDRTHPLDNIPQLSDEDVLAWIAQRRDKIESEVVPWGNRELGELARLLKEALFRGLLDRVVPRLDSGGHLVYDES